MSTPLRLGLVGLGNHTFQTWYNSLRWAPPHQLVTVVDVQPARVERFRGLYAVPTGYTDHREAFRREELDAVIIQTGHATNGAVIADALHAGLHVLVEKTPVASVAEGARLVELARQVDRHVMVGFNRRFMTSYRLAHDIVGRPEFGPVQLFQSQFHATPYAEDAFVVNHLVHHLDLARWLLGEIRVTSVQHRHPAPRRQAYLIGLESEAGAIGTISGASMLDEQYPMERLELVGDLRNVVVDNVKSVVYNRPPVRKDDFTAAPLDDRADALVWNPNHGYYPRHTHHGYEEELHHFVSSLAAGEAPGPDLEDALASLALVEDVLRGATQPDPSR